MADLPLRKQQAPPIKHEVDHYQPIGSAPREMSGSDSLHFVPRQMTHPPGGPEHQQMNHGGQGGYNPQPGHGPGYVHGHGQGHGQGQTQGPPVQSVRELCELFNTESKSPNPECNLYIANLPHFATDLEVAQLFAPFGELLSFKLVSKKQGEGRAPTCNAYLSFKHQNDALNAIQRMNNSLPNFSRSGESPAHLKRKPIWVTINRNAVQQMGGHRPSITPIGPGGQGKYDPPRGVMTPKIEAASSVHASVPAQPKRKSRFSDNADAMINSFDAQFNETPAQPTQPITSTPAIPSSTGLDMNSNQVKNLLNNPHLSEAMKERKLKEMLEREEKIKSAQAHVAKLRMEAGSNSNLPIMGVGHDDGFATGAERAAAIAQSFQSKPLNAGKNTLTSTFTSDDAPGLFIAKLHPETDKEGLEAIFARYGEIKSCNVVYDENTKISKCYGFVNYIDPMNCGAAIAAMNGQPNSTLPNAHKMIVKMKNLKNSSQRHPIPGQHPIPSTQTGYQPPANQPPPPIQVDRNYGYGGDRPDLVQPEHSRPGGAAHGYPPYHGHPEAGQHGQPEPAWNSRPPPQGASMHGGPPIRPPGPPGRPPPNLLPPHLEQNLAQSAATAALAAITGGMPPGFPMPGMPGMPGLPGLPGMPGMPGISPPVIPGMPNFQDPNLRPSEESDEMKGLRQLEALQNSGHDRDPSPKKKRRTADNPSGLYLGDAKLEDRVVQHIIIPEESYKYIQSSLDKLKKNAKVEVTSMPRGSEHLCILSGETSRVQVVIEALETVLSMYPNLPKVKLDYRVELNPDGTPKEAQKEGGGIKEQLQGLGVLGGRK